MMHGRLCDEATSALDSSTEGEILASLRSLANDRTAIFIAHRLTTAMQCDEVSIRLATVKIRATWNVTALDVVCYCMGLVPPLKICFITGPWYASDMTYNFPHRFAPDCRFGRGSCCGARQPRGIAFDEWPLRPTLESTEQH
jgi:energy-coupling factor transporter ATP-binding protein EcfA2